MPLRVLILWAAVLAFLLNPLSSALSAKSLAGLSAEGGDTEKSTTTIRFVSWKPNQPPVWDEALRRFSVAHPEIKVVREIGPHSSTEYHDLLTQKLKNRDSSVDVFFVDVIWPSEFAAAGWALPLDDRFLPEERGKFMPGTIQAGTYQGHIYGIPGWTDSGMLYYRKDLLKKYGFSPPKTWAELVRQAAVIVEGEKNPGLRGYSGQFKQYEGLVCNMLEFVESNGGHLISPDGSRSTLATPQVLEALRFVQSQIIGKTATKAVLTYQEPESLAVFTQGKAVFMRNWPYAWKISNDPDRSRIAGNVGVTTLPSFPKGPSVASLGGWLYGISAYTRHAEEAWTFISFMTSPEMQKYFAINASRAPARKALYNDPEVLAANPQFKDQFAVFETAIPRPRTPIYPAVSSVFQRFFSRALSRPDEDLDKSARAADRQVNRLLNLVRKTRTTQ